MRDLPGLLLLTAAVILQVLVIIVALDRGWLPTYTTSEEARAVRARPPWDVRR